MTCVPVDSVREMPTGIGFGKLRQAWALGGGQCDSDDRGTAASAGTVCTAQTRSTSREGQMI